VSDFFQDSHVCDLGELLNKGRRTLPRVRRALNAAEHAQRPTPHALAPRQAAPVCNTPGVTMVRAHLGTKDCELYVVEA
jgi:hypothetical protein